MKKYPRYFKPVKGFSNEDSIHYRIVRNSGYKVITIKKNGSSYVSDWSEKFLEEKCEEMTYEEAALYI